MGTPNHVTVLVTCLCLYASIVLAKPEAQSNEITFERMQIFVNVTDGPTLSLSVETDSSVSDLVRDLIELEGIPFSCNQNRIMMGNIELSSQKILSDYHIQAGTTLTLDVIPGQYADEIIVRTHDGQEVTLRPQYNESVASSKRWITQLTGIPVAEQRLLFKGKELKDDRKLIHYDIGRGSILDLGRPLEDCRQVVPIIVKTLSGATIEVEANLADTVNDLKEKIREKAGVPTEVQRLSVDHHERVIAGEDHLCDLGLGAGSKVDMYFYSTRITDLYRVARLREPSFASRVDNHRAPIFHEAEDGSETEQFGLQRSYSFFKDLRNWVPRDAPYIRWEPALFDPIAHLAPNPDEEMCIDVYRQNLKSALNPEADEWFHREARINSARLKLSLAVRPYRLASNLNSAGRPRQYPGITLGGGSIDESQEKSVPLGADVNNWAPDAFADSDLMRLFEVAERVRQVLASGPKTGDDTLSIPRQRQINHAILSMYLDALADNQPMLRYDQPKEGEECFICRDELMAEPAAMLPCKHAFHLNCIVSWLVKSYQTRGVAGCCCGYCRQRFLLPYDVYGKAELESSDLQVDQDERDH